MTRDARPVVSITQMQCDSACSRINQRLHEGNLPVMHDRNSYCVFNRAIQKTNLAGNGQRDAGRKRFYNLPIMHLNHDFTSQATSGVFSRAEPIFPCTENCFGQPMLISMAETSCILEVTDMWKLTYTTLAASTAIVPVGAPNCRTR